MYENGAKIIYFEVKCDKSVAEAGKTAVFRNLPGFEAYRVVFELIFMCPVF